MSENFVEYVCPGRSPTDPMLKCDRHKHFARPMNFMEVVRASLKNKQLVAEFDRLTGSNLSLRGTGLDLQIDVASGRLEGEAAKFVKFVKDCVWDRMWQGGCIYNTCKETGQCLYPDRAEELGCHPVKKKPL